MTVESMLVNPFASDKHEAFEKKGQNIESVSDELNHSGIREALAIFVPKLQPYPDVPALTPTEIDVVLSKLMGTHDKESVEDIGTGIFLGRLISESYHKLNNMDFTLTTRDYFISGIGLECEWPESGRPEDFRIHIIGNAGYATGSHMRNSSMTVSGDCSDHAFLAAYKSDVLVYGNSGINAGSYAQHCRFTFLSGSGRFMGANTNHCEFTVYGDIGPDPGKDAYDCTIRSQSLEQLEMAYHSIPKCKGNRLVLIDSKGKEIETRDLA